ncbi:MAG: choice-of-anchor B family protein [Flavobacteriales bacterium]
MRSELLLLASLVACTATAQTPCAGGFAGIYPCNNVDLLARMTLTQLGGPANVADITGWTDPLTGKEYGVVGCSNGTAFVDLSVPTAPVLVGTLPTHTVNSLWRDVDVAGNWCYVGSEASGHGLQIFDLTRLRNASIPTTFTEDAHFATFGNSHTIHADVNNPFVYAVGTGLFSGGLVVVNVTNPLVPTLAGSWATGGYIHENMVINYNGPDLAHVGKQISFNFHINANDRVTITDVTNKADIQLIGTTPAYSNPSLCHQGWVTEDHRYLLMDDEGDEPNSMVNTRTHIFNIQDLEAPVYLGFFSGPNASVDHNQYIHKNLSWQANYTSGLHIVDLTNVGSLPAGSSLSTVGYFDTYTTNNGSSYNGAWSNYPYFNSGIVIVSSISEGLFVLRPRLSLRVKALLEGPYDQTTGLMYDSLRVKGQIPAAEPYTDLSYTHVGGGGETTTAPVLAVTGPNAIVDWVVVELRDAITPTTVVATRSALIQRDGDIVGTDGTSPVQFTVAVKDYHIAVRHRNHLGAMTAAPQRVSVALKSYDLTNGSVALYGTEATKTIGSIHALWAGNTLRDGELKYMGEFNDRDPILVDIGGSIPTNTTIGYALTDVNMDGRTIYVGARNDRDPILVNIGGSVPTNTRTQQVP